LLPLVSVMVERGNRAIDDGFILNPDGWRCRMQEPLDVDLIAEVFGLPGSIHLDPAHDTVVDQLTWCSIEGPGARR
jgi:hypothetical protein